MSLYATIFQILTTTSRLESTRLRLMKKLHAMADLPEGWSYGEGKRVSEIAIAIGQRYVAMASQLNLKADVFPNPDGGCAIAFYSGDELVEISISPDGERLDLRAERGFGYDYENTIEPIEAATPRQVYDHILRLIETDTWKLSVSSIYASTGLTFGVFETLCIEPHRPLWMERPLLTDAGGSQSSKPLVPAHP